MINGLTQYLTLDGTDLSYVFSPGTTNTKSGYLLSDEITDLSDIFASKGANTATTTGYKYINAGIETDINQLYAKMEIFSVSFDTPTATDSQFFKQTTSDELYDVYTIVGQTGIDGASLTSWVNKSVVASFKAKNTTKTIEYVCIGGGGYTYIGSSNFSSGGGGGAGAYFEGSINISNDVSFNFTAGGSYKTSNITSTLLNVTAGYGGVTVATTGYNGINGGSGGGAGCSGSGSGLPGLGSTPGYGGGTASPGNPRSAGGGGGAGGPGVNGLSGSSGTGTGGAGGIGKIPSSDAIRNFYPSQLCVGGGGHGTNSGTGATSSTYGSGAGGRTRDGSYRYGRPGAIIIAIPKT
jgi:hypothetical protein